MAADCSAGQDVRNLPTTGVKWSGAGSGVEIHGLNGFKLHENYEHARSWENTKHKGMVGNTYQQITVRPCKTNDKNTFLKASREVRKIYTPNEKKWQQKFLNKSDIYSWLRKKSPLRN